MEELQLLDAIERYLNGEMSDEERNFFEQLRKDNPEVDQRVVEHTIFLQQMERFGEVKNLKSTLNDIHHELRTNGDIVEKAPKATIIDLWKKYKRVVAVAASIAGITALSISVITYYFTPKTKPSDYLQLVRQVNRVENKQAATDREVMALKNKEANKTEPSAQVRGVGTGFLIDGNGYLVTSAHVVVDADSVYVQNLKGDYFKGVNIYLDKHSDIAILKLEDPRFQPIKNLPYSIKRQAADLGEEIFTLGYPRPSLDIVYNRGYLSANSGYNGDTLAYQIAISANPGNSGGPIFNEEGDVIGVLSGKQVTGEGVFFSSRAKNIFTALREIRKDSTTEERIKPSVSSSVKSLSRTQQIKKIEECVFMVKSYGTPQ